MVYEILKKKGIFIGDRVRVGNLEGILMPKTESSSNDIIILKLDNGYNIGIKYKKGIKIKLIKKLSKKPNRRSNKKMKFEKNKPTVSILGCGGTIASRVEYKTGAVFPSFSPEDLVENFPELEKIANIDGRKIFNLLSEDIHPEYWKKIAKEVYKEIKNKKDGIVLMHGTDTMHYTSAALSFMIRNLPVPVILVGAQRSSDRPSSDNKVNLISSVLAASQSDIAEVSVCMHGSVGDDFCLVHQGTKVRKMHTSRRDAFQSINVMPFAKIWYEEKIIQYLRDDYNKRDKKRKPILDIKINPNVGIFYFHPGAKPKLLKEMGKIYDGIVIASTGLGHVGVNPTNEKKIESFLPVIKNLISSGVPIVFAPQTIKGRLNLNVYLTGRLLKDAGVIGDGCDWTIETAAVKLMWVLGHTKSMKKIREMMLTNYAGEISERSMLE